MFDMPLFVDVISFAANGKAADIVTIKYSSETQYRCIDNIICMYLVFHDTLFSH